jgi:hypothetical protein
MFELHKFTIFKFLRETDCSRHIGLQNIHFNKTRVTVAGTNKAGGPTRQAGQVNRCAGFNCQHFYFSH